MTLSDDQRAAVSKWISEGATLADIQRRLKEDFAVSLTYLEARLLADDLKLTLAEKPRQETILPTPVPAEDADAEPTATPGKVSVKMDQITKPGALISGSVTFSDGKRASWFLDQMGRLGLDPDSPGHRPSQQDIMAFQIELEKLARSQGM